MKHAPGIVAGLMAACTLAACASAETPPPPVPGGPVGTLTLGNYTCELPGDASGPRGKELPDYAFRVVNASNYKAGGVRGSYLYTGDRVIMTGGKFKGLKFRRVSTGFLRQVDDAGKEMEMRCVLTSRAF